LAGRSNPRIVGDIALIIQRDIKIGAHEHPLARYIGGG
jgi:hypothetical protein